MIAESINQRKRGAPVPLGHDQPFDLPSVEPAAGEVELIRLANQLHGSLDSASLNRPDCGSHVDLRQEVVHRLVRRAERLPPRLGAVQLGAAPILVGH